MGVLDHPMDKERDDAHPPVNPWSFYVSPKKSWRKNEMIIFAGLWKCPPLPRALLCSKQLKMKNRCRAGKSESCCDNVVFWNNGVPLAWALFRSLSTQPHLLCRVWYFLGDFRAFFLSTSTCSNGFSRGLEWPFIWTADLACLSTQAWGRNWFIDCGGSHCAPVGGDMPPFYLLVLTFSSWPVRSQTRPSTRSTSLVTVYMSSSNHILASACFLATSLFHLFCWPHSFQLLSGSWGWELCICKEHRGWCIHCQKHYLSWRD